MVKKKKLKRIGFWVGLIIALIVTVFGILLVTKVIAFEITTVFLGWFLIIIVAYSIIEYYVFFIVKAVKI